MTDGPSPVDPLVAEGPLTPVESLRPATNLQRVLLLDGPSPMMADLATGDVRPYENGPPVSVPMVSARFDAESIERLQVQVLRDPRPTSVASTLWSLHLGESNSVVDVVEQPNGTLDIIDDGKSAASTSIGSSPAVVVVLETAHVEEHATLSLSVRNAESGTGASASISVTSLANAQLTIGGPSTVATSTHGRRRTIPVLVEATRAREPVDQLRRAVGGLRRAAGSLRDRRT